MLQRSHIQATKRSAVKPPDNILPATVALRLADYKRAVMHALPGVEKLILFGSRARGGALPDSDYDVAVLVRDLSDRRHISRVLSDLAYDQMLSGFVTRPIPLPTDYLTPRAVSHSSYYAMFHAARAVLFKASGGAAKRHDGVTQQFGLLARTLDDRFRRAGKALNGLKDERPAVDYDETIVPSPEEAREALHVAVGFLAVCGQQFGFRPSLP